MISRDSNFTCQIKPKDCIQGMQSLPDKFVDIVVTSPPYNLGINYTKYDDNKKPADYLKWSCEWAKEVMRVLKDDGSFFLNLGSCPSNPFIPHELVVELKGEKVGFILQNTFHWIKSISVVTKDGVLMSTGTKDGERLSVGHYKPLHSKRFVNDCHEYVFHLTKHGETLIDRLSLGVPYSDKSNIARWAHTKGRDLRCRGNNWFIPYKTIVNRAKERPHPATFPVELAENCIQIHGCTPESVMLDPFVGIGNSAVAARRCGIRRFIGFDIDSEYVRVARVAWQQQGKPE